MLQYGRIGGGGGGGGGSGPAPAVLSSKSGSSNYMINGSHIDTALILKGHKIQAPNISLYIQLNK